MFGKLLTECIGTFFLMLTIGLTVLSGLDWAPVVIGSVLMVMVYMGGHISGGHYNPAVTLAALLRGKVNGKEAGAYMLAQLIGSMLAALVTLVLVGDVLVPQPGAGATPTQIVLVELLFTFALCLTVLNVATSEATEGNSFYGVAIGFIIMVGVASAGSISGGAFNPAVGVGPALVSGIVGDPTLGAIGYYLLGPFLGALLAALVYRIQEPKEFAGDRATT